MVGLYLGDESLQDFNIGRVIEFNSDGKIYGTTDDFPPSWRIHGNWLVSSNGVSRVRISGGTMSRFWGSWELVYQHIPN